MVRPEQHEDLKYKDKAPGQTIEIVVTIYWTRETGRSDKAHFLKYHLDPDFEDSLLFKVKFNPEKIAKIRNTRIKTPPKRLTAL